MSKLISQIGCRVEHMDTRGCTENIYVEMQMVHDLVKCWHLEIQGKQTWRVWDFREWKMMSEAEWLDVLSRKGFEEKWDIEKR